MHPIAQRLAIHAGQLRRFNAGPALQDQRDGQQAPNLSAIAALCCELAQCLSRVLRPCDRECLAHLILLAANRRWGIESQSAAIGNPPRESGFWAAGITAICGTEQGLQTAACGAVGVSLATLRRGARVGPDVAGAGAEFPP